MEKILGGGLPMKVSFNNTFAHLPRNRIAQNFIKLFAFLFQSCKIELELNFCTHSKTSSGEKKEEHVNSAV